MPMLLYAQVVFGIRDTFRYTARLLSQEKLADTKNANRRPIGVLGITFILKSRQLSTKSG
jgi:hypothetical protein